MNYYCSSCNMVHSKGHTKVEVIYKTGFTFIHKVLTHVGTCR